MSDIHVTSQFEENIPEGKEVGPISACLKLLNCQKCTCSVVHGNDVSGLFAVCRPISTAVGLSECRVIVCSLILCLKH